MVIERLGFDKVLERLPVLVQRGYMAFVVVIAWVFFRAADFTQSILFIKAMFGVDNVSSFGMDMILNREVIFAFVIGVIMSLNGFNWMLRKVFKPLLRNAETAVAAKWIFLNGKTIFMLTIFIYSALTVAAGSYNPFIYFRF